MVCGEAFGFATCNPGYTCVLYRAGEYMDGTYVNSLGTCTTSTAFMEEGGDDVHENIDTCPPPGCTQCTQKNTDYLRFGQDPTSGMYVGLRFRNVKVPQAFESVRLHITAKFDPRRQIATAKCSMRLRITAVLQVNPTLPCDINNYYWTRARTMSSVMWTHRDRYLTQDTLVSPDLSPLLAEVAALPG
jgi:hypothetical protein